LRTRRLFCICSRLRSAREGVVFDKIDPSGPQGGTDRSQVPSNPSRQGAILQRLGRLVQQHIVLVRESVLAPTLAGVPSRKLAGSESCEQRVRDRNLTRAALSYAIS
jgi:hypothetical protein